MGAGWIKGESELDTTTDCRPNVTIWLMVLLPYLPHHNGLPLKLETKQPFLSQAVFFFAITFFLS